jgi:hypothetical protein
MLKYMYKARRKATNENELCKVVKLGTCSPKNLIMLRRVLKSSFLNFKFSSCDCMTFSDPIRVIEMTFEEAIAESMLSAVCVLVMIIDSPIVSPRNSGSHASPNEISASSPDWSGHMVQRVGVKKNDEKMGQ